MPACRLRPVIPFTRLCDLAADKFIDHLHGSKWAAAQLVGFDGAYLRFAGELRIEQYKGEQLVERHADEALWELMYFGSRAPESAPEVARNVAIACGGAVAKRN